MRVKNIRGSCRADKDINAEPKRTYQARRSRQVLRIFVLQFSIRAARPKLILTYNSTSRQHLRKTYCIELEMEYQENHRY